MGDEGAVRVVQCLPVRALWRDGYEVCATRGEQVDGGRIRELLREPDVCFVVANVGEPFAWFDGVARFELWKSELQPRLVNLCDTGAGLDDYPGGRCYFASEWRDEFDRAVVLFEKHH